MPKAMEGQMTINSLVEVVQELLDGGMPLDTPLFWYFGTGESRLRSVCEFLLQAETGVENHPIICIEVPISAGGPA